jgi:hypothetical protein
VALRVALALAVSEKKKASEKRYRVCSELPVHGAQVEFHCRNDYFVKVGMSNVFFNKDVQSRPKSSIVERVYEIW